MPEPDVEGYKAYIDDINKREISNSETYDKSLLTLSSAFLGLSLTFTKDVVPLSNANYMALLLVSWGLFALTIILTISSFIFGQHIIERLKDGAKEYFIERKSEVNELSITLSKRQKKLNALCGVVFIVAIVFLTLFITLNVAGGGKMDNKQSDATEKRGQPVPTYDQVPQKLPQKPNEQQNQGNKKK